MPTTRSEVSKQTASVVGIAGPGGAAETATETSASDRTPTDTTETVTTIEPPSASGPPPRPEVLQHLRSRKPQAPGPATKNRGGEGASSAYSKAKSVKIAKAKAELLQLRIELAAAKLAALEDSEEDEDLEDHQDVEQVSAAAQEKVGEWFSRQEPPQPAVLAIADTPHQEPSGTQPAPPPVQQQQQQNFSDLAAAITQAVRAAQRPKMIELPNFSGAHQEWLPFKAAYIETEESYTAIENLNRLRRNLRGKAKEAVESLLITNSHPADIIRTLESRFGRPEAIATTEIEALRSLPKLTETPRDICIHSTKVTNAVAILKNLNCIHYLFNPEVTRTMVEKLTPVLRYRYYDYAATQNREMPDLVKYEKFMKREADLCGPYAQPENFVVPHLAVQQRRPQRVNTTTEAQSNRKCLVCSEQQHPVYKCEKFKKADSDARWDIAKAKGLCFRCLKHRDRNHTCEERRCGIENCNKTHNSLLHYRRKTTEDTEKQNSTSEAINSAWTAARKETFLKILPVQLSGPAGIVNTFALMDDGSTVTLLDDAVADKIGASGPTDPLRVKTINNTKTAYQQSRRVTVRIKGIRTEETEEVQARTVKNLAVSSQRITYSQLRGCSHLEDIRNDLTYEEAKPKILIGQDNWHLLRISQTRTGQRDQPVASHTPLGWVLHGSDARTSGRRHEYISHMFEEADDSAIEQMVKQHFEVDNLLLNPRKPQTDPDEQASRILQQHTVHKADGRYETALLWKHAETTLPNNYENSLRRLQNIEKKLDRDPDFKQKYTEQMDALLSKGYAELAPSTKTKNKTWYLPHFAVFNPMKPGKIRVVHDAAAKTRGVSLNDTLLRGPDLLQSLPGVVMRFRQHSVAVTADIGEMFLQVKIREQDRDALRYLWRGDRRDEPPVEYRMTSLIFGAASSPSTAIYVKNSNAEQYRATHPEAVSAIVKKHYVDDYLDSFKTLEDAIKIASDVRMIHREAKFELKQWKSNSPQLLEALGVHHEDTVTELYRTEEQTERVLGLIWKPGTDELTFNLNLARIPTPLCDKKTPTKREALRIVMSLFDPLGFASPVTIRAKQLLQEIWRRGTEWDQEVSEDIAEKWKDWIEHLKNLADISIPRRYLSYSDCKSLQLHVFTDASESAYSTVLYWRTEDSNGEVNLSLVVAKAKVAPLKLTSIPRLELQAAVMGTRLAEAVIEEHERKPDSKTFWTDSRTVLTWIKTGSRSYKPYVAHRLAAIEDSTTVNEWRWVPTKLNVADDATRDVPTGFSKQHRWYRGPDFLYLPEASWPQDTSKIEKIEDTEEKVHHVSSKKTEKLSEALPVVSRFSSWDRLRYATARVLQFVQLCRKKTENVNYRRTLKNKIADPDWRKTSKKNSKQPPTYTGTPVIDPYLPVTAELLRAAEDLLMRAAQQDSFTAEIEDLQQGRAVHRDSRLHQLSVITVNSVLRVRSRIQAARDVSEDFKSPIIIDGDHPTVKLWIEYTHRRLHHSGVEATVNECRQHYWVIRLRPVTRSLLRRCLHCRIRTQVPPYPRTGDLPECRLAHHKRPFTHTGVDYFGPLTVTVGRTNQKRYVAIFTCLTTRAIHLEIASSLSTDSAISALRRMMARRGCPEEIWSDNGTNLKGADRELRRAIDQATEQEAAKKKISWRFIPPGAPFMGGAWERMVRSVKTALTATLHERRPSEEVLATLLAEVEYTVNSRPLTHVSVTPEDPEALTPNHFLLGGPGGVQQPGAFNEKDGASKSSWRAAQRLADLFWARWLREYLPELQNRRMPDGRGPTIGQNDLVLLVDPNAPRNLWLRGRVIATFPGPDGVTRTVDIQTKGGVLRRPVRKLIVLLSGASSSAP